MGRDGRRIGKARVGGEKLYRERNARPAAGNCRQWGRAYCLRQMGKSWSCAQGDEQ